ncbi:MAG: hypothetical protein N2745_06475 [Syntrophorhabdaceae bacterium]|nr:hypothetical protein [Syntrophorhabdaceae bacterium]
MDKLFTYHNAIIVGDMGTGKSTLIKTSLMPQLAIISPNLFYCELWMRPVDETKDVMFKKLGIHNDPLIDIASLSIKLLEKGPCFFILDSFERYKSLENAERGKLDRFIEFCSERDDVYIILSGDRDSFFEWGSLLSRSSLDSVYEIKIDKRGSFRTRPVI